MNVKEFGYALYGLALASPHFNQSKIYIPKSWIAQLPRDLRRKVRQDERGRYYVPSPRKRFLKRFFDKLGRPHASKFVFRRLTPLALKLWITFGAKPLDESTYLITTPRWFKPPDRSNAVRWLNERFQPIWTFKNTKAGILARVRDDSAQEVTLC